MRTTSELLPAPRWKTAPKVSKSPQISLSKAPPCDSKTPTILKRFCWYLTSWPSSSPPIRCCILWPTITSSSPGVKRRPSTSVIPPRTSKARGVTARSETFAGSPSVERGRPITTTHSQDAIGCPLASRATRSSTRIMLRSASGTTEVSSEVEPRCTTIALSARPVVRSAAANPSDIDISTAKTATTSAMPPTASSVSCQRTRTLRTL